MRSSRLRQLGLPLLSVATVLAVWAAASHFGAVDPAYLPPPGRVLKILSSQAFLITVGHDLSVTLLRAFAGYAMAAACGIPLGILLGRSTTAARLFAPIVEFLRPLPSSAIIPVALLFLGLGSTMKIAVVAFGCTWPILVSATEGASNIDRTLLDTSRLLRFSAARRLISVYLPSAAPFIAAGMRTSLAVSLILSVTAEMIVGGDGIGFYIIDMERAFRTPEMYSAIAILGVAGYILNAIFMLVQRRIIYWER